MRRLFLTTLLAVCCASAISAQTSGSSQQRDYPKVEVFAGYSAIGEAHVADEEDADFGTQKGFQASVIGNFNKYVGLKGDFSFHFDSESAAVTFTPQCATPPCSPVTQEFRAKTRLYNFLVGPEFKARNHTRLTPFAHALFGVAHGNISLTTSGPALNLSARMTDTGFAMAFGGGLDIRATRRISFRAMMDYNPAFIGETEAGTRDRRDHVRLSLGILFR